jgi:hypothetical protein
VLPEVGHKVLKEKKQCQDYILCSLLFLMANHHGHLANENDLEPMRNDCIEKLRMTDFYPLVYVTHNGQEVVLLSILHVIRYWQVKK